MRPSQISLAIWMTAGTIFAASTLSMSPGYARLLPRTSPSQNVDQLSQSAPKDSLGTSLEQSVEDSAANSAAKGQRVYDLGQAVHNDESSSKDAAIVQAAPGRSTRSEGHQKTERKAKSAQPSAPNVLNNVHHDAMANNRANPRDEQKDFSNAYHESALATKKAGKPDRRGRRKLKALSVKDESLADGHWERYENLIKFRSRL